jgi:hypothetical protein
MITQTGILKKIESNGNTVSNAFKNSFYKKNHFSWMTNIYEQIVQTKQLNY